MEKENDYVELTVADFLVLGNFIADVLGSMGMGPDDHCDEARYHAVHLRIHSPRADGRISVDFAEFPDPLQ